MIMKKSAFILLLMCSSLICYAAVVDISGKWANIMTNYNGSKEKVVYIFKINGSHITGNLAYRVGKFTITSGSVRGDSIHFEVSFHGNLVSYKGEIYRDSIGLNVDDDGHIYHVKLLREKKQLY